VLAGPYCSACGQHDIDYHRSIGHLVEDSLEGVLHYDGRFIATVRYGFTRPGYLTREFNAGRRIRYTHPLRFYVFASFLYFLVTSFLPQGEIHFDRPGASGGKPLVSAATLTSPEFGHELLHLLPEAMFICVPVLALLLCAAFRKPRRYYVEHFICALHLQAFWFLAALVIALVEAAIGRWNHAAGADAKSLLNLGVFYLLYRALRTVYGETRWRTFLKFVVLGFVYMIVTALALALTVVVAAALVGG
jgi:hypothetical protein